MRLIEGYNKANKIEVEVEGEVEAEAEAEVEANNTQEVYELKLELKNINENLNYLSNKLEKLIFFRNILVLMVCAVITLVYINRTGSYPWGSDTFGHLFKGNILSDSIKNNKLFLNYNESWYNGTQPFRYWAPLPYYILAIINLLAQNIILTFNIYICFIFLLGGFGWLCFGYYIRRQNLGLILALLWFFVPDNIRVFFSEGNLPFTLFNALLPLVFLYYYKANNRRKLSDYIGLVFLMAMVTLTHAMLAAMLGLSLLILWLAEVITDKHNIKNFISLSYAFMGIMVTAFWLYPALKGGIMSLSQSAVATVMQNLTFPLSRSLNPMLRFSNIEVYYFGLGYAALIIFGLMFCTKNERALLVTALVILLGTTKAALIFLQQLPMNQLFWMSRFTSISMVCLLVALIKWKTLKRNILGLLILILLIDSGVSFYLLGFNVKKPSELSKILELSSNISIQRIAVLDSSSFGSFPSYYLAYNTSKGSRAQVYGWAWQGATTSKNIMMINTSLENGYYSFMFDRVLELGADTLIVRKTLVKDEKMLNSTALSIGYKKYYEDNECIIYKYPVTHSFSTSVNYKGIAIGTYSDNMAYIFPELKTTEDKYIDDYSYEELKNEPLIYLSGFAYKNKEVAQALILKLLNNNVRVVIDMEGMEEEFLGVTPEPIMLKNNYGELIYQGQKLVVKNFPEGFEDWKTCFLSGIASKSSYCVSDYSVINYIGSNSNLKLSFIGLNLPYYAFLTKNNSVIKILEDSFKMKAYEAPKRVLESIDIVRHGNIIDIKSNVVNVLVPIAALDAFKKLSGDYYASNNLIYLKTPELKLRITYPYLYTGIGITLMTGVIIITLSIFIYKGNRERERKKRFKYRFKR